MTANNFRIHPAIGIARVGNSPDYYLGPETEAGTGPTGGLPVRPGTEDTTITSSDLRDAEGRFKRQAARFRIYRYPAADGPESYPLGLSDDEVVEVTVGSEVGERTVTDITWMAHVANKKANTFVLVEDANPQFGVYEGICGYSPPDLPPIRNWSGPQPEDKIAALNDPRRVRTLTVDPGPRTISGKSSGPVAFDRATPATYLDGKGAVRRLADYPRSFPDDSFSTLDCPQGAIDTLGELATDAKGRLIVLPGYGRACGWGPETKPPLPNLPNREPAPFQDDVNNDQWFDDASDGPVTAVIHFDDGTSERVRGSAWVVTTDPAYAPQILNVVTLFDDVYDTFLRRLKLEPRIYDRVDGLICDSGVEHLPKDWFGGYNAAYRPEFGSQLEPVFQSAALARWTTNLNLVPGVSGHKDVGKIHQGTHPGSTPIQNLAFIRLPGAEQDWDPRNPQMPAALGDANQSFLTVTPTQYFFLSQWATPPKKPDPYQPPPLGPGEALDRAVLVNCLGGRFSPGIDLNYIVRLPEIYIERWQTSGAGPFRIRPARLNYRASRAGRGPLLSEGYVPLHVPKGRGRGGLEPGDVSKFMAIPWHTDYNSCATHLPSPNPPGNQTEGEEYLFWSWPAQRPVAVYVAEEVAKHGKLTKGGLPLQRWSLRGKGTSTNSSPAQNWGRYQTGQVTDFLTAWADVGVVLHASAIDTKADGAPLPKTLADTYLEAQSRLETTPDDNPVVPFPNFQDQLPPKKGSGS